MATFVAPAPTHPKALELTALWGDTVLDAVSITRASTPRVLSVSSRSNPSADLHVDAPWPSEPFPLIAWDGERAELLLGEPSTIALGERAEATFGAVKLVARVVDVGAVKLPAGARSIDWTFVKLLSIAFVASLFFVLAAWLTPRTADLSPTWVKKVVPGPGINVVLAKVDRDRPKLGPRGPDRARHKGKEGAFGPNRGAKRDAAPSKPGAPRGANKKREDDLALVHKAGLLAFLSQQGSAAASVLGPGGIGTGINEALGGIKGAALGDASGAGGLGTRGAGPGGGGSSLEIGGLATHGRGPGGRDGGGIDLGGTRPRRGPDVRREKPAIEGDGIDKEEVSRVIRRNLSRFKFCYEKELNADPNIGGKVSIWFEIAPTGAVGSARIAESALENAAVEGCVLSVMRSLEFPPVRGGGIAVVTYPFIFAPG